MSDIVLAWTAAELPVQLRTEAMQDLYPLIWAMSIKEIIQKSGYLRSCGTKRINSLACGPVSEAKPTLFVKGLLLRAAASL